mgnify:CR=1 FL=1
MNYLNAFWVGGLICALCQVLIDKTKLTPARVLVSLVVLGVILQGLGWYQAVVDYAGAGATVPLLGFGYSLAKGVAKAVAESGLLGVFTGVVTGAALETVAGGVGSTAADEFFSAFRLTVMSTMTAATTAMSKMPPNSSCHFVLTAACSAAGVPAFALDVRSGMRSADFLRLVPQYGQRLRRPEYSRPQRRHVILGMTLIKSLQ